MDIESLGFAHKYDITGGHQIFGEEEVRRCLMFESWDRKGPGKDL